MGIFSTTEVPHTPQRCGLSINQQSKQPADSLRQRNTPIFTHLHLSSPESRWLQEEASLALQTKPAQSIKGFREWMKRKWVKRDLLAGLKRKAEKDSEGISINCWWCQRGNRLAQVWSMKTINQTCRKTLQPSHLSYRHASQSSCYTKVMATRGRCRVHFCCVWIDLMDACQVFCKLDMQLDLWDFNYEITAPTKLHWSIFICCEALSSPTRLRSRTLELKSSPWKQFYKSSGFSDLKLCFPVDQRPNSKEVCCLKKVLWNHRLYIKNRRTSVSKHLSRRQEFDFTASATCSFWFCCPPFVWMNTVTLTSKTMTMIQIRYRIILSQGLQSVKL